MTALFLNRERNGQQHFSLTVSESPGFSRHGRMYARTIRAAYQATLRWTQGLPCFERQMQERGCKRPVDITRKLPGNMERA